VKGKDVAEVMAKAEEHARTAHGMMTIPPEVVAKVRAAIKDEQESGAVQGTARRESDHR